MKYLILLPFLWLFSLNYAIAQDNQDEIPGDHFDLQGALDLLKKSASPEDFEKRLNEDGNLVNNLDLNNDGQVDYLRVVDNSSGDDHALVIQDMINDKESQDVAVIEIEKTGDQQVELQIVGDEDLFASDNIAEPYDEAAPPSEQKAPNANFSTFPIVVNVWGWPCVRFVYAPIYRPWVSPWRWRVYPNWWKPWRPHPHTWFIGRRPVYVGYRYAPAPRLTRVHAVYAPHRSSSTIVRTTHKVSIDRRRQNTTVKSNRTKVESRGNWKQHGDPHEGSNKGDKGNKGNKVRRARR